MSRATFTIEIDFDRPIEGEENRRYVCASLEEGIGLLWHDYMVNVATIPQTPQSVCVRWTKG